MARILFLSPQPFFQERGTPIAIDLALRALEADGHDIDLLTYPEGETIEYVRTRQYRVPQVPGVSNVPPGFSWKKLIYSSLMAFSALRLAFTRRYDFVHAVEEASFIALMLKLLRRIPYVYDMDSSIAQQMVETKPALSAVSGALNRLEGYVIRHAIAVVAVCPALVELAEKKGACRVLLLQDISLLHRLVPGENITNLRMEMDTRAPLLLYVGNLERYQGIDLLLEGFSLAKQQGVDAALAVVGGRADDISRYRQKAEDLGLTNDCRFFGPRPVNDLCAYLEQADILVSPRCVGNNTPMKIYSYLASGKALLATQISSHTQALDDDIACLVVPTPEGMAEGIARLCDNDVLRQDIGEAGKRRAGEKHNYHYFSNQLKSFYQQLEKI